MIIFFIFSYQFIVLSFHVYVVLKKKKSAVGNFDAQEEKIGNSSNKEIL
jgi:hypothetical protein